MPDHVVRLEFTKATYRRVPVFHVYAFRWSNLIFHETSISGTDELAPDDSIAWST